MNTISLASVSLLSYLFALLVFVHVCIKNGETALLRERFSAGVIKKKSSNVRQCCTEFAMHLLGMRPNIFNMAYLWH